jgi:CheY-like chemotaxis protein
MATPQTPYLLIVDDDLSLQAVFKYIALNFNLKCKIFSDAEGALESVVKNEPYTQIYLDWRLPGMSGLDCAKQIQKIHGEREQTVPIIACTAYASQTDRDECLELVDDYLSKPFTVGQFLDMVSHWSQNPDDASVHDSEHTGHTTHSSRKTFS